MIAPLMGEFFGTLILVLFGCGVVANVVLKKTKGADSGWIVVTAGWAFAVTMGVFVAEAIGSVQADINPAVTFAKLFMGVYSPGAALLTMIVQFGGGFFGGCLVFWFYQPYFAATENQAAKLGVFCTAPNIRNIKNAVFCEIAATIVLIFVILSIFAKLDGKIAVQFGPYLVGILVWAIGLSLGGTTGYAINPARDFGPRLAHAVMPIPNKGHSDWSYALVPLLAPFAGGAIAYLLATLLGIIH